MPRIGFRLKWPMSRPVSAYADHSAFVNRRRVEAIQSHVFRYALPRRRAAVALAFATSACAGLGGLTLTRSIAEQQDDKASTVEATIGQMTVRAIADKSGEPLADVKLE